MTETEKAIEPTQEEQQPSTEVASEEQEQSTTNEQQKEDATKTETEDKVKEEIKKEFPDLTEEQYKAVIDKAIEDGRVVDYETRFKPIYGALKKTERELEAEQRNKEKKPTETVDQKIESQDRKPADGNLRPRPKPDDFGSYDEYVDNLTDWKLEKIESEREVANLRDAQKKRQEWWTDQVTEAEARDPKFKDKAYIPNKIVPYLDGSKHVADFGYYFGEHPEEGRRIADLPPVQAAREIGRLEAHFQAPKPRTETKAPVPTKPLGGAETVEKDPSKMSQVEYEAWRASGGGT